MEKIVCVVDVETTGLDLEKDYPVEIGWVIAQVGDWRTIASRSLLTVPPGFDGMRPEIEALHGLKGATVANFGTSGPAALACFYGDLKALGVDYIVAHNGEMFDKPMLAKIHPGVKELPWIDTRADVEYPDSFVSRRLVHLAAEYGFVNPFPHTVVGDCLTTLMVLSKQDFPRVVERAASPWVIVQAAVSYDDRDKAKKRRYNWERIDEKTVFPKKWVKKIKLCDLEKEKADAGFPVAAIGGEGHPAAGAPATA